MPDEELASAGVRIPVPHTVSVDWRLVGGLVAIICAGTWFMAVQSTTIAANAKVVEDFQRDVIAHREASEIDRKLQLTSVGAIDTRLTRIEAEIELLLTAQAGK